MRGSWKSIARPLAITLSLVVLLEILSSTLLPLIGLTLYRIPFNILVVLFMGFKLNTPHIGVLILIVQYFHGFFSIEGWELGTIAGVLITILISYLKELLHFTSAAATILVTQLFQMLWFIIVSSLIYLKTENTAYIIEKLWRFLPESVIISLMAPFFFVLFDQIWAVDESGMLGDQI